MDNHETVKMMKNKPLTHKQLIRKHQKFVRAAETLVSEIHYYIHTIEGRRGSLTTALAYFEEETGIKPK